MNKKIEQRLRLKLQECLPLFDYEIYQDKLCNPENDSCTVNIQIKCTVLNEKMIKFLDKEYFYISFVTESADQLHDFETHGVIFDILDYVCPFSSAAYSAGLRNGEKVGRVMGADKYKAIVEKNIRDIIFKE